MSRSASQFIPKNFPTNLAFISPFWADSDVTKGGAIWYRLTTEETIKNRATYDVKTFFPKMTNFQASWVIVATWYDLPFYGCSSLGGCLIKGKSFAIYIFYFTKGPLIEELCSREFATLNFLSEKYLSSRHDIKRQQFLCDIQLRKNNMDDRNKFRWKYTNRIRRNRSSSM